MLEAGPPPSTSKSIQAGARVLPARLSFCYRQIDNSLFKAIAIPLQAALWV